MQKEDRNDSLLWDDFKDGNADAFSSIYFAHYNSIYHYAIKFCPDKEFIKDVIHEMFIRFWDNRKNLNPVESVKFYLLKSIKRELIRRTERAKKQIFLQFDNVEETTFDFSAEDLIIKDETNDAHHKLLIRLLDELPKRQKEALYLKYYESLTNDQIAEIMNMNPQSVANLIQRGLKTLKEYIKILFLVSISEYYFV